MKGVVLVCIGTRIDTHTWRHRSIEIAISLGDSRYWSDEWPEAWQAKVGMLEGTGVALVAAELSLYPTRYKKESK